MSVEIFKIQALSARDGRFIKDVSSSSSFACCSLSFALGSMLIYVDKVSTYWKHLSEVNVPKSLGYYKEKLRNLI